MLAEVSGVDRLLLLAGRHALLAAGAAFSVPLFLGGGAGPLLPEAGWQLVKTLLVLLACWSSCAAGCRCCARSGSPRSAGSLLLPLTLLQVLVTSLLVLAEAG